MIGFENVNARIIAGSVSGYNTAVKTPTPKQTPPSQERVNEEIHNKKSHAKAMKGATILAGVVVAGITITKLRGPIWRMLKSIPAKFKSPEPPVRSNYPSFTSSQTNHNADSSLDQITNDLFENERLKDIIREKFPKYTNIAQDSIERQKERLAKLINPEDKELPFHDDRLFTSHEAEMVGSYQDEYAFNPLLRMGKIKPEKSIEIRTLDKMMIDAEPLPDEAVVYRGVVTKHDNEVLDFSREYYAGNIVEDKAYVSTSRNAAETIAQFGENSGYVIKLNLPKGTKGIDCRRFTMLDLPTGANAEFILPRGSKFKINAVDDNYKLIEADYLLPN